jgi:outer membrane protein assembly factor BamB
MKNRNLKRTIIADGFIFLFLISLLLPMTNSQSLPIEKESIFEGSACDYKQKNNVFFGPMDSSWPMFGHDAKHTGRSPYSTENNSGVKLWEFRTEYLGIDSSPAIDSNGTIYFGSNEGFLHAFYPNGTEKWRADCGDWAWITSSPAIAEDGTIYVGSWDDHLYAINPDGTRKWRFYIDDILGSPVIDEDGIIYFGVTGPGFDIGRVYALYPNGTEKWHFDTGFWIYTAPAIGEDGTVYVTSEDNRIYALYPNNGTCMWSYKFGDWPGDPSIADDGTIYFASWDDYLYALYPNGTCKWRHSIDWGTGHAPAIGSDGTIYIGEKYLYAVNPNGTRKWTFKCGESQEVSTSCSISSDGTIYFGTQSSQGRGGYLIALNPDGSEKWREWIHNERCHSTPAIAEDGTIYIGTSWNDFGVFYAFGEGNRRPNKPEIIGTSSGKPRIEYEYTFVTDDYEGGEVWYYIEWGDDTVEDWFGPYDSGDEVVVSHTWEERGTYVIRAKAKDFFDEESDWGTLEVSMPVNQQTSVYPWFHWFLNRFPNAFPILRQLLDM